MPEYEHCCLNTECNHEWCDTYSIKSDPPTTCPACHQETAKRLISGGSGKGIVALSGAELVAATKAGAAAIEKHAAQNEGFAASFIGDGLYERKQQQMDKAKRGW